MSNSYLEVTGQAVVSTEYGDAGAVVTRLAEGQKAAELMAKVLELHPRARKVTLDLDARQAYVFGKSSGRPSLADGEDYDALLKLTAVVTKARGKPGKTETAEKVDKSEVEQAAGVKAEKGEAKADKESAQD